MYARARGSAKLRLYKMFAGFLAIACVIGFSLLLYAVVFKMQDGMLFRWKEYWAVRYGIWQMLFFCMLVGVCILWRPTRNSMRFAYTAVESEDHDEMELFDLGNMPGIGGELKARTGAASSLRAGTVRPRRWPRCAACARRRPRR